ncbi:MAG: carbon-nitrogen hydrolase family protein [Rhodoferax sp.]
MQIALVQMVSNERVEENLEQAAGFIAQAAAAGAELVALPEYFCLMGQRDADKLAIQEPAGQGPLQQFLAEQARRHGVWLLGGTLPLQGPDAQHVYNSALVYDPQGRQAARYDKMHLFCFDNGAEHYDEARVLTPGSTPVCFDLPSRDGHTWRIGLGVCYDLRFPEFFRHYAAQGADLLLLVAAFTYTTGQAHWEVLLRARAIENLCFVAASAQGGTHRNGRRTWGQSLAIDPWGQILAQQAQEPGLVLANLQAQRLGEHRRQLPALQHRRL